MIVTFNRLNNLVTRAFVEIHLKLLHIGSFSSFSPSMLSPGHLSTHPALLSTGSFWSSPSLTSSARLLVSRLSWTAGNTPWWWWCCGQERWWLRGEEGVIRCCWVWFISRKTKPLSLEMWYGPEAREDVKCRKVFACFVTNLWCQCQTKPARFWNLWKEAFCVNKVPQQCMYWMLRFQNKENLKYLGPKTFENVMYRIVHGPY